MALTFVGAVKAVSPGDGAAQKMFFAALGCNLAWGLADAVMYLIRTLAERGQRLKLVLTIRQAPDKVVAVRTLRDALPKAVQSLVEDADLECIRARLVSVPTLPLRATLGRGDFVGALGIFLHVVLGTLPVALPFVVIKNVTGALITSRMLTLVMLFAAGSALGRCTPAGPMKAGLAMVAIGVLLTISIIVLGG
ncbi:hypothetical protein [Burkholderia contaminans]|uniref:hypothetical protein n=1 Tax=Burkholderia contaminans TaxID=488447 RepID=UPI0031018E65